MGVMPCGREGCTEIMCQKIVVQRYICDKCLQELREDAKTWDRHMEIEEIADAIEDFFSSPAGECHVDQRLEDRFWRRFNSMIETR